MSRSNDGSAFDLSDVSQLPHTSSGEGAAKRELADTGRVARFECGEGIGSPWATLGETGIFQKTRSMGNRANDLAPGVEERRCLLRKTDTEIHPSLKSVLPILLRISGFRGHHFYNPGCTTLSLLAEVLYKRNSAWNRKGLSFS